MLLQFAVLVMASGHQQQANPVIPPIGVDFVRFAYWH
jgi:hypothetical protein